ncbi:MAG: hypothetical protein AAF916_06070 [Planctomycetota bacterium]
MLLSSVPTFLPDADPRADGAVVVFDTSREVASSSIGELGRNELVERAKRGGSGLGVATQLRAVSGGEADDILIGFDRAGDFRGGGGRDRIAVLPVSDVGDLTGPRGTIDAGAGDDVIYVYDADTQVDGGAGYDILFTNRTDVSFVNVEEVWRRASTEDPWQRVGRGRRSPFAPGPRDPFSPPARGTTAEAGEVSSATSGSGSSTALSVSATTPTPPTLPTTFLGDWASEVGGSLVATGDGVIDGIDLDFLDAHWDDPAFLPILDVFPDGVVDRKDAEHVVLGLAGSQFGVVDLQGNISQGSLDAVLVNWGATTGYSGGNFSAFFGRDDPNDTTWQRVEQSDMDLVLAQWGWSPTSANGSPTVRFTDVTPNDDPLPGEQQLRRWRVYGREVAETGGDEITANPGTNLLWGGGQGDTLRGGAGGDALIGGTVGPEPADTVNLLYDEDLLGVATPVPGIVAQATIDTAAVDVPVTLDLNYAQPHGPEMIWQWDVDWGDGSAQTFYGGEALTDPPTHTYTAVGDYTITVRPVTQLGEALGAWGLDTQYGEIDPNDTSLRTGFTSFNVENGGGTKDDNVGRIALTPDGRAVVAGRNFDDGSKAYETDAASAVLKTNGTLDTTYDGDGIASRSNGGVENYAGAVVRDLGGNDFRIFAGGTFAKEDAGETDPVFTITRYNPDGTLDNGGGGTNFHNDGNFQKTAVSGRAWSTLQAANDDRLLIAGYGNTDLQNPTPDDDAIVVAQFDLTQGTPADFLDDAPGVFGTNGVAKVELGYTLDPDGAATVDAQGRIVVAASSAQNAGKITLVRFDADGTLDANFGINGIAEIELDSTATVQAVTTDVYGRVLVVGQQHDDPGNLGNGGPWFVARTTIDAQAPTPPPADQRPDDQLDLAFGGGFGYAEFFTSGFNSNTSAHTVLVTPGQRIVVAGQNNAGHWAVLTLNPDGTPDTNAAPNGAFDLGIAGTAKALQLQADGRLLVAGDTPGDGLDFAVARLDPTLTVDLDVLDRALMEEQNLFATNATSEGTFVVANPPGSADRFVKVSFEGLTFDNNAQGDDDTPDQPDAFEVSLVRAAGDPYASLSAVPTIDPQSTAVFNLTQTPGSDPIVNPTPDAGLHLAPGTTLADFRQTGTDAATGQPVYAGTLYIDLDATSNDFFLNPVDANDTLRLTARLVNNDADDGTKVRDLNLHLDPPDQVQGAFAAPTGPGLIVGTPTTTAPLAANGNPDAAPNIAAPVNLTRLVDVTNRYALAFGLTTANVDTSRQAPADAPNPRTNVLHTRLSLTQRPGPDTAAQPRTELLLAFPPTTDQDGNAPAFPPTLLEPDGRLTQAVAGLPAGTPYLRLTALLQQNAEGFVDNQTLDDLAVRFAVDPDANARFDLQPVLLAQVNQAPDFVSEPDDAPRGQAVPQAPSIDPTTGDELPVLEIRVGNGNNNAFIYTPELADPDRDRTGLQILAGPASMLADADNNGIPDALGAPDANGLYHTVSWTPETNDFPAAGDAVTDTLVTLRAVDQWGLADPANDQTFRLRLSQETFNRTPRLTSPPRTAAPVGESFQRDDDPTQPYFDRATAFDPDGDPLNITAQFGAKPADFAIRLFDIPAYANAFDETTPGLATHLQFRNVMADEDLGVSIFSRIRVRQAGDAEPQTLRFDTGDFKSTSTNGTGTVEVLGDGSVVRLTENDTWAVRLPNPVTVDADTVLEFTFAAGRNLNAELLLGNAEFDAGLQHIIGLVPGNPDPAVASPAYDANLALQPHGSKPTPGRGGTPPRTFVRPIPQPGQDPADYSPDWDIDPQFQAVPVTTPAPTSGVAADLTLTVPDGPIDRFVEARLTARETSNAAGTPLLQDTRNYAILLEGDPNNRPPEILSDPSRIHTISQPAQGASVGITPDSIALTLSANEASNTIPVSIDLGANQFSADIVFLVDGSGSMNNAWDFIGDENVTGNINSVLPKIEQALAAQGVTNNRYAVQTHGGTHRFDFDTAANIQAAVPNSTPGDGTEDGWKAIESIFDLTNGLTFRPNAAKIIVMASD